MLPTSRSNRLTMAFGSESEESDAGILSKVPSIQCVDEAEKNLTKSVAYWKSKNHAVSNEKKKYCCVVKGCFANFSRPWRLNAHLSLHFGKKPFTCNVKDCNKSYTSAYHLRRHKDSVHESASATQPLFKCEFLNCKAEFKTRQNARKHFKRTHEGRTCKECGQIFAKRLQLVSHQYIHTGVIPYKCISCDIGFVTKGQLRRHERGHREHICPEKGCFLAFTSWNQVRSHLLTHPHNYVCILCRKSYVCRNTLKKHIRKHADPDYGKRKNTSLKTLQCDQCSASLVGKASLRRHISVIHEGKQGQGKIKDRSRKRALRKDKGSVKNAMAAILANVEVPVPLQKKLIQGKDDVLGGDDEVNQIVLQHLQDLQETEEESLCSSNDDISNGKGPCIPEEIKMSVQ